jgi:BirA family biotin operon repressor/biotin-[acetyl-CoA-carboxylase] ligase
MTPECQPGADRIGRRLLIFDSLASTNSYAARLAADPAHDGTVILAREQTAGRGQPGRRWHSPAGGVWMSVIVRPPAHLRRPVVLTAWAAVAVCEAIRPLLPVEPTIKWPNDVLIDGRKTCGILVEQGEATIVGIGLNVNVGRAELDAAGLLSATSLSLAGGRRFDTDAVAARLIQSLGGDFDGLLNGGEAALGVRWAARLALLGHATRVGLIGGRTFIGRLTELTFAQLAWQLPDGSALFAAPEQVRQLSCGDQALGEAGDAVGGGGGEIVDVRE